MRFLPVLSVCLLSSTTTSMAAPPSLEEIKSGLEDSYVAYNDLEFVYDVTFKKGDGTFDEVRKVYRLHIPKEGHPWQCILEVKKSRIDQVDEIHRFAAFNGEETWMFSRSPLREGNWSHCAKVGRYQWDSFVYDSYSRLLTRSIVGLPFVTLTPDAYEQFWTKQKARMEFAGKRTLGGDDVWIFKGSRKNKLYEWHFLGPPRAMMVRAKATNTNDNSVEILIDVEKIGDLNGITYPQKGKVFRTSSLVSSDDVYKGTDYSFRVIQVTPLKDVRQDTWFPEIPPGTAVANHITGEDTSIPFSDRQRELIAEQSENLVPPLKSSDSSRVRMICVALTVSLILLAIVIRFRRKKKTNPTD